MMSVNTGAQFVRIFCLVLLPFIGCNEIHKRFTEDEVLETFHTDPDSVPDYELMQVWHTLDKRDTSGEMIFISFDRSAELKLYLKPSEGFLVGEKTPVWLSRGENGKVHYTKLDDFILRDVANLYLDTKQMASISVMHAQHGLIILGSIKDRHVGSLPSRFKRDVTRKNNSHFQDYGFPDSADPDKKYINAGLYIMWKDPMLSDDNIIGFAIIDAGIGESQMNTICSSMNIPSVSSTLLKRHERVVGPAIEAVAKESCIAGIKLEKQVSKAKDSHEKCSCLSHLNSNVSIETDNKRHIREIPKIVYPELLIVTDYNFAPVSPNHLRFHAFLAYILAFWNGVDLRFRSLKNPKVRLQIVGIIVGTNREALPWMAQHVKNGTVNVLQAVHDKFDVTLGTGLTYDYFDMIVTQTNQPLCMRNKSNRKCDVPVAGYAYADTLDCSNSPTSGMSILIVKDIGRFVGIRTAAHEIGHALGAVHDGERFAADCNPSYHLIMAEGDHGFLNYNSWSSCSRKRISSTLKATKKCVRNSKRRQDPGRPLPPALPGQVMTHTEMCRSLGWLVPCEYQAGHCDVVRCWTIGFFTSWRCTEMNLKLLDGSECGVDKYCLSGSCVNVQKFEKLKELEMPKKKPEMPKKTPEVPKKKPNCKPIA